jgi:prepilin-type processing-associated H-X9-DG protein
MANTDLVDALRHEDPIEILTDDAARAASNIPSYNADMGDGTLVGRQIRNVRFRHNRDTVAVVAFADGSVRTLGLNKKRLTAAGGYYSDFQRQMLMIRGPGNLRTSGTFGSPN